MKTIYYLVVCLCLIFTKTENNSPLNNPPHANTNSTNNSNDPYSTDMPTNNPGSNNNPAVNCNETASETDCYKNSNCCYVWNSYGTYSYQACVDVKSSSNYVSFCKSFWALNANNNYISVKCSCGGNFNYTNSSFIKVSLSLFPLLLILITQ